MSTRRTIYHGTTNAFREAIREFGVPAVTTAMKLAGSQEPEQPIALTAEEAKRHARASAAYYLLHGFVEPKGLVVCARVPPERIHEVGGERLRARIKPGEITSISKPIEFPEFGALQIGGRRSARLSDARESLMEAHDEFEALHEKGKLTVAIPRDIPKEEK